MNLDIIKDIIGGLYIGLGILDAAKYHIHANSIRKNKTSMGHSRRFVNITAADKTVGILFGITINNWMVIFTSTIALVSTLEYFWMEYLYYPYRRRGLNNFSRPSLYVYFINSLLPNNQRKRL